MPAVKIIPYLSNNFGSFIKYGSSRDEIKEAIEDTATGDAFWKKIAILATVEYCPSIGILGTVFGMIKGFR